MKKMALATVFSVVSLGAYSQGQVGIGTRTPNASSQLEIVSNSKGVLFPQVNLTSTTDNTSITPGNINSLFVYNTAYTSDVTPGYYYWYQNKWQRLLNGEDVAAIDNNAIVAPGTGISVVPNVSGNITTYTVSANTAGITLNGDVTGAANSTKVEKIQGTAVSSTAPNVNGQVLTYNSSLNQWEAVTPSLSGMAESGVEIHDGKVKLGGNLTRATTISNNGNAFTIATGGSNLAITGLDKTKTQATNATTGITQHLMAVNQDGTVKALKAAMPKFFYMPSVLVPTAESQLAGQTGVTYNNTTRIGTIDLYQIYSTQFGSPVMSSTGAAALPVLPASELGYHVTHATSGVFTINSITPAGLMTYTVSASANINNGSFINIVFAVKED